MAEVVLDRVDKVGDDFELAVDMTRLHLFDPGQRRADQMSERSERTSNASPKAHECATPSASVSRASGLVVRT